MIGQAQQMPQIDYAEVIKEKMRRLDADIRSGAILPTHQVPAVLELQKLKSELQMVTRMSNARQAQAVADQPASTVLDKLSGDVNQPGIAVLAKDQASRTPVESTHKGGISDILSAPAPETNNMAEGGSVKRFYQGQMVQVDDEVALQALPKSQLIYFNSLPNGRELAIAAGKQVLSQRSQAAPRYSNVLPTGDITANKEQRYQNIVSPESAAPYAAPDQNAMLSRISGATTPPSAQQLAQTTPEPAAATTTAPQTVSGIAPLAPGMAETLNVLNNQSGDQRDMAARMQLGNVAPTTRSGADTSTGSTGQNAATSQLSPAAQQAAQSIVQEAVPAQRRQLPDYINELKGALGESKSDAALKDFLAEQGKDYAGLKKDAQNMALLNAGLAIMAGTSPFALANIGAGGMKGVQTYMEDMKDLRKEQEKARELQIKGAQLQDERNLAIAKFGAESKHSDDIQDRQDRNTDKQIASHEKIAQMQNDVAKQQLKISETTAGRPTEASLTQQYIEALNKGDTKTAANIKAGLDAMNSGSYGSSGVYKQGVELRAAMTSAQKDLNNYLKDLSSFQKTPDKLAKNSTYLELKKKHDDAVANHRAYVSQTWPGEDKQLTTGGGQQGADDILKQYGITN